LKVTVLPLADFFVQLLIISSPPNGSQVSSRVCHFYPGGVWYCAIRSGSVSPAIPKLGDAEENTTHDTAKRLPVTARASLVSRPVRNRGTGRVWHLLGTCLEPSLLASISLSDCTPFRQFCDRIKKMTGLRKRVSIVAK
jgi:hypothetical protein